jgi:hypothetical protein
MAESIFVPRIIDSPAVWTGADMQKRTDWIYQLSADEIAEIDAAYRGLVARGIQLTDIERENFPLPLFAKLAAHAQDMIENGPGIFLIRGFPAEKYEMLALRMIYWGLGKYLGTAVTQSSDGDLLGDVRDASFDINSKTGRGYRSSQELTFHCDSADVTALFVLRTAMTGGMSGFASSVAVHNEVVRRDPELAAVLYQPFYWSLLGQEQPGEAPYYEQPVFSMQDGYFSQRFVRAMIYGAEKHVGAPPMNAKQRAALDLLCDFADNSPYSFRMMLTPGDLEILNNHTTMHARTEFKDHGTRDTNRHLLRLWLSMPNSRPLSPLMNYIYRDQSPGAVRGGFRAHGNRRIMETPL